jgi:hypothetical protein
MEAQRHRANKPNSRAALDVDNGIARESLRDKGLYSEKLRNAVDEFDYLLLHFIAVRCLCRQPLAAGPQQSFKFLADLGIGLKVSRNLANSSAITIRGRLVKAANGIAQTIEQDA